MKKIRVIQVVEDLPVGGLETALKHIVSHLDTNKFDVRVCCLEEGGKIADELRSSGHVIDILGLNNYYHPKQISKLARYFCSQQPDIVHTHGEFASTFGRIAALLARVPIILRHIQTKATFKLQHRLYDGLLTRLSSGAVAVSKDCAEHHVKLCHTPRSKIFIVPNGVDPEAIPHAPLPENQLKKWGINDRHFLIGCVGRLSPIKGHIYMLRAMPEILEKYQQAHLIIIGEGPERQRILDEAKKLGISDKITLTGLRRDVGAILKSLHTFVLPSTEVEGLPLSVAEAMCAKVPVVASDVGGVSEIVNNGKTGLLVPPKDPEQLSKAILRLLNNPELSKRLATEGKARCLRDFDVRVLTKKLEMIYERFLLMKRSNPSTQAAISL